MNGNRLLSLIFSLSFIFYCGLVEGSEAAMYATFYVVVPLFIIWFPDYFNDTLDIFRKPLMHRGLTVSKTPRGFMLFGGWLLLLLPLIAQLIILANL
jgi:hypothetical protein